MALCVTASPAAAAGPLRVLVAFGTNEGLPAETPLRYAEDDARQYADTLARLGALKAENRILITGGQPEALVSALTRAAERARQHAGDVTFFFYFSGHGDDQNLHIAGKRFAMERLDALISAVPAKLRVAVIDACRGQTDTTTKGFGRAPRFEINLAAPTGLEGVVTLRSSSRGEQSQESSQLKGAVFTHYLTTALRGAGDRDRDNRVTLQEAYTYAYRQTVRRSAAAPGEIMHPSVELDVEGAGEIVLTRPEASDAVIVLHPARDALFLVFNKASAAVEAEVWASPQRSIPIRVPAGSYLVHRRDGLASGALTVAIGSGEERILRAGEFQRLPESLLAAKGGELRLFYQSVEVGYAGQLSHTGGYGQSVRLRYAIGGVHFAGGVGLELGEAEHRAAVDPRSERWIGGDLRLTRRRLLGDFDVFGGAAWRVVSQVIQRANATLLVGTGATTEKRFVGFGLGGVVGVAWHLRLGTNWGLSTQLSGTALVFDEGGTVTVRPEGTAELGVVRQF